MKRRPKTLQITQKIRQAVREETERNQLIASTKAYSGYANYFGWPPKELRKGDQQRTDSYVMNSGVIRYYTWTPRKLVEIPLTEYFSKRFRYHYDQRYWNRRRDKEEWNFIRRKEMKYALYNDDLNDFLEVM